MLSDINSHPHSKTPASSPGLVEFFLLLLLPLRCLVDFRNLGYTVSLLLALFPALFLVRFLKAPAPELIAKAAEEKVRAEMKAEEQAKRTPVYGSGEQRYTELLTGKEITYTGNLYDRERRKSYPVKNVKIDIAKSRNGVTTIWMNDTHFRSFFRELWNKLQKMLGLDTGKGLHL